MRNNSIGGCLPPSQPSTSTQSAPRKRDLGQRSRSAQSVESSRSSTPAPSPVNQPNQQKFKKGDVVSTPNGEKCRFVIDIETRFQAFERSSTESSGADYAAKKDVQKSRNDGDFVPDIFRSRSVW